MQPLTSPSVQQMLVHDENDVISLRQAVRQMARTVGLGLPKQARITAAISEIARMLLLHGNDAPFTLRVCPDGPRPALEVICRLPSVLPPGHTNIPGNTTLFCEACSLVDEFNPATLKAGAQLTLRMWIRHE